jgi:hypothetical protein
MIGAIVESAATEANRFDPSAANANEPAANANSPAMGDICISFAVANCPGSAMAVSTSAASASVGSMASV